MQKLKQRNAVSAIDFVSSCIINFELNCINETQLMSQENLRNIYERVLGKRVSDVTWYKNRQLLEQNGFQCNSENIRFLALIKKAGFRSNVSAIVVIKQYNKAQELLSKTNKLLSGKEIKQYLNDYGITPHQSTVSAWFKELGGYRRSQLYNPKDLVMLFTKAFIYKLNTQQIEGEK